MQLHAMLPLSILNSTMTSLFFLEKGVHSQCKWKYKGIIVLSLLKSSIQSGVAARTRQDRFPA